jgi:acyl carrier protein
MEAETKNMIDQLSKKDEKHLRDYMERSMSIDFSEDGRVFRDDIRDNLIELIHTDFIQIEAGVIKEESILEKDLELDAVEITAFADTIANEFNMEEIAFSEIMKWETVKDVVDYIEERV